MFLSSLKDLALLHAAEAIDVQEKILDFGCGFGRHTAYLHKVYSADVLGVDADEKAIATARKKYGTTGVRFDKVASTLPLPFPSGHFRVIHCYDVLEHVDDPLTLLAEFRRVLEPGGSLRLEVPHPVSERFLTALRPSYPAEIGHLTVFTRTDLLSVAKAAGFQIVSYAKRRGIQNFEIGYNFLVRRGVSFQQGSAGTPKPLLALSLLFQEEAKETALARVPGLGLFRALSWIIDQVFPKSQRLELIRAPE